MKVNFRWKYFSSVFRWTIHKLRRTTLTMSFRWMSRLQNTLYIEYEGSNIGPADGQIESYASRARELSARASCCAAALAMRAAWSDETVCLAYGKKVLRFQEDLTATGFQSRRRRRRRRVARRLYFHFRRKHIRRIARVRKRYVRVS